MDSHRAPFFNSLRDYARCYPNESEMVERFCEFVSSEADCFRRECLIGHVTGSAWIVNLEQTAVLLTHHRKLNLWLQPGGHCDGEPSPSDTARREALEETGLQVKLLADAIFDVDIHAIPERKTEPEHFHYDARYLLQAAEHDEYVVSEESHNLAWVPFAELEGYTREASILRMREKWYTFRQNVTPS